MPHVIGPQTSKHGSGFEGLATDSVNGRHVLLRVQELGLAPTEI